MSSQRPAHITFARICRDLAIAAGLFLLFGLAEGSVLYFLGGEDLYGFLLFFLTIALFSNLFAKFATSLVHRYS